MKRLRLSYEKWGLFTFYTHYLFSKSPPQGSDLFLLKHSAYAEEVLKIDNLVALCNKLIESFLVGQSEMFRFLHTVEAHTLASG